MGNLLFLYYIIITIVSSVGTARAATDFREHYLGPLYPSEQYKMYPHYL